MGEGKEYNPPEAEKFGTGAQRGGHSTEAIARSEQRKRLLGGFAKEKGHNTNASEERTTLSWEKNDTSRQGSYQPDLPGSDEPTIDPVTETVLKYVTGNGPSSIIEDVGELAGRMNYRRRKTKENTNHDRTQEPHTHEE
jgi:hypothetical protein